MIKSCPIGRGLIVLLQIRKGGRKVVGTVETDKTVTTDKTARAREQKKIVEMVRGGGKERKFKKIVLRIAGRARSKAGIGRNGRLACRWPRHKV